MKKYIAVMLALLFMLSLVACVEKPGNGSTAPTSGSAAGPAASTSQSSSQTDPSQSVTTVPTTAPTNASTTVPTGGEEADVAIKTTVLHCDTQIEFQFVAIDDTKGILTIAEVLTASAEDMEDMGLSGSLVYKPEICTFEVSFTKTDAGVYTATGSIVSVAASVEGESAEAFIQMVKQSLGESKLDEMTGRVLDGEVLTQKEDIEWLLWEYDVAVKVTFCVENGALIIREFEKTYISWGYMMPTKEIRTVENGVVRSYVVYEQDEKNWAEEYWENGVLRKVTFYFEGEVSNEIYYDENGDEILRDEE